MTELMLSEDYLATTIYSMRGEKIILDRDIARLYGIETKRLKEAVRRNIDRFPLDFMFELTENGLVNWRTQFASSNSDKMGLRYAPMVFTEQGVAMLSSVINSPRAINVNIAIMWTFVKMRTWALNNQELATRLQTLETKMADNETDIDHLFDLFDQLSSEKQIEPRPVIGFKK